MIREVNDMLDKQFPIKISNRMYQLVKVKAAFLQKSVASVIRALLEKWLDGEVELE